MRAVAGQFRTFGPAGNLPGRKLLNLQVFVLSEVVSSKPPAASSARRPHKNTQQTSQLHFFRPPRLGVWVIRERR
jgi:hypothetical protein